MLTNNFFINIEYVNECLIALFKEESSGSYFIEK